MSPLAALATLAALTFSAEPAGVPGGGKCETRCMDNNQRCMERCGADQRCVTNCFQAAEDCNKKCMMTQKGGPNMKGIQCNNAKGRPVPCDQVMVKDPAKVKTNFPPPPAKKDKYDRMPSYEEIERMNIPKVK